MQQNWVEFFREQFPVARKYAFFDVAYENCGALFLRQAIERFFDAKENIYPGIVKAGGAGAKAPCARPAPCSFPPHLSAPRPLDAPLAASVAQRWPAGFHCGLRLSHSAADAEAR